MLQYFRRNNRFLHFTCGLFLLALPLLAQSPTDIYLRIQNRRWSAQSSEPITVTPATVTQQGQTTKARVRVMAKTPELAKRSATSQAFARIARTLVVQQQEIQSLTERISALSSGLSATN